YCLGATARRQYGYPGTREFVTLLWHSRSPAERYFYFSLKSQDTRMRMGAGRHAAARRPVETAIRGIAGALNGCGSSRRIPGRGSATRMKNGLQHGEGRLPIEEELHMSRPAFLI